MSFKYVIKYDPTTVLIDLVTSVSLTAPIRLAVNLHAEEDWLRGQTTQSLHHA